MVNHSTNIKRKGTTIPHLKSLTTNEDRYKCLMKFRSFPWWDLSSVRVPIGRPIEN